MCLKSVLILCNLVVSGLIFEVPFDYSQDLRRFSIFEGAGCGWAEFRMCDWLGWRLCGISQFRGQGRGWHGISGVEGCGIDLRSSIVTFDPWMTVWYLWVILVGLCVERGSDEDEYGL